jgi:hypothetical protein
MNRTFKVKYHIQLVRAFIGDDTVFPCHEKRVEPVPAMKREQRRQSCADSSSQS